jgi:hypothetical protein
MRVKGSKSVRAALALVVAASIRYVWERGAVVGQCLGCTTAVGVRVASSDVVEATAEPATQLYSPSSNVLWRQRRQRSVQRRLAGRAVHVPDGHPGGDGFLQLLDVPDGLLQDAGAH